MKRLGRNPVFTIPFLYAFFGLLWIVITDLLLVILVPQLDQMVQWQTYKGWLYVIASTLIIYLLLASANQRQQKIQDALASSEELYRLLFENNPLPMWVYDSETLNFLAVNEAAVNKYGYPREQFLKMTLRDIRPADEVDRLLAEVAQTAERLNFAGEWRHRRRDGTVFPVEIISHSLPYNGRPARLVVANDITERKQAEAERERLIDQMQAQTEQMSQIMRSVPEGVVLIDPEEQLLMANPPAKEYLDLLATVQVGDTLTSLGDQPLEMLLTSPPPGKWHELECNGRTFELIARPLESGPVSQGWVLVLRDVTEKLLVQEQLQRQERLASIGQLAAGIAHDFNNIIAVIMLYAQLMQISPDMPESAQSRLATINEQAGQATRLIQQILDFSRRSVLERQPLDLLPLLREQIKLLERTLPKNIEIKLDCEPDDYLVQADPTRIQQAIMNLALNARDAMPHGGRLQFTLAPYTVRSPKQAPLPQMAVGEWIRLTVTDTGSGIEPATLDHVFEPFFTTKEPGQGTGLGLAQVHGIIGQHGGAMTVTSKVGQGATFIIYLPALITAADSSSLDENAAIPSGAGELVLIVEDEKALRQALVESLILWDYQVLAATNGQEALDLLEERGTEINVVVSDVIMPKMGGFALIQTLREQGWKMPVILLSGHPLDVDPNTTQKEEVYTTLPKPIQPFQLAQAIAAALGKRP